MKDSQTAIILRNRSAFALFLNNGIEEVKKMFPDCVEFVEKNSGKTLDEITIMLNQLLEKYSFPMVMKVIEKIKIVGGYNIKVNAVNQSGKAFIYTFVKTTKEGAEAIVKGYQWEMGCKPNYIF